MMKQLLATSIFAALLLGGGGRAASADNCSQRGPGEKEENYKQWAERYSGVIFAGRLMSVRAVAEPASGFGVWGRLGLWEVTFEVEEMWKGPEEAEITVRVTRFPRHPSWLVRGELYFIEASEADVEGYRGHLTIWPCGASRKLADASTYMSQLGAGRKPQRGAHP